MRTVTHTPFRLSMLSKAPTNWCVMMNMLSYKAKVDELATSDGYSLFVAGLNLITVFEFSIGQRSRYKQLNG